MLLIIAQIIGVAAVALYLLCFQLKKRTHIILANSITNCLYVLQYILLGLFQARLWICWLWYLRFWLGKRIHQVFGGMQQALPLY